MAAIKISKGSENVDLVVYGKIINQGATTQYGTNAGNYALLAGGGTLNLSILSYYDGITDTAMGLMSKEDKKILDSALDKNSKYCIY